MKNVEYGVLYHFDNKYKIFSFTSLYIAFLT